MIDRRLSYVQNVKNHLLKAFPDWSDSIVFEEPPAMEGENTFDLAIPCFSLSKSLRKPPTQIAELLVESLKSAALPIETAVSLKGYVNLRFESKVFGQALVERWGKPLGDSAQILKDERIILEFSSPNIAKPFGIGHLRSTNIGAALGRIFSALGAEIVRINHLGDWGTQFGKMISAYKRFGSAEFVKGDPVNNLYKLYVEFHEKEKNDPSLLDEAREWFVKLENGDAEAKELWSWFKDVSYHEFKRIYDKLHVEFDYVIGESFYNDLMKKSVERLEKAKLLKESDGALIVDLEAYGMPPCLIRKSDGSTLYATRDIASAEYRVKTFNPTKMVYVVGSEQTLHFNQVFKILSLMGYSWAENCVHVGFGLIRFPEGKMSTRRGNIVLLEEVLKQAEQEALQIIKTKDAEKSEDKKLTDEEQLEVARQVGTGAVIFFDLKAKRTKDVAFDWKEILNFEGNSGPYLQYTYVRMGALLEKAQNLGFLYSSKDEPKLITEEERLVARKLLGFPAVLEAAARDYEPSVISHELLDLAGAFNRFYMNIPLLKGEQDLRAGRLALVHQAQTTLELGLKLLGIECPKRM